MAEEAKEELYHQIGMSGLKYYLLKVDPKKRMMFNPQESIDLNGNELEFNRKKTLIEPGIIAGYNLSVEKTFKELNKE